MKKRVVSMVLALLLLLGALPAASATEHGMTDISGHWAEEDIAWVLEMGLFNGTSTTAFSPNTTMTRGMFVTVLGRYAGVDPDEFEDWYLPVLYEDVNADSYYAPYVNWATRHGITSGTSADQFSPNSPVTREQMAVFLVRFANVYGYLFEPIREDVASAFADSAKIAKYAVSAVETMRECGLINGRSNGEGGYNFDPKAYATRAECAAVFHRLMSALVIDEAFTFLEPEEITVSDYSGDLMPGDTVKLTCETVPAVPSNTTILWISSNPEVASVSSDGTVTCLANGEAEIYAYTCNGLFDYRVITIDGYIGYEGESYESKCMHIFGRVVDDPRHPYNDNTVEDEFVENLVTISVQVWDFKNGIGSEKVTKTRYVQVHKNLAATVKAVFAEIYACEEKYPICSLGGYRWSTKSEHTPGLALDVNYEYNPYMDPNGKILVGEEFDPENNPYSIPVDGEVQQIFEKYGFTRGIYWRSGYKDYMHFSFFGT